MLLNEAGTKIKRPRSRQTIGLLIDWIGTPYHAKIMEGVQEFCQNEDLNLLCFVTGRIGSDWESEQCRNVLTELASERTVDGLIVCASSMQNFAGYGHMREFLKRYVYVPLVTLHERYPGLASVAVDNEAGMRQLMEHLAAVHGYRRFAFVRGVVGNRDFDERYRAWKSYLAENDLSFDEGLVFQGDYNPAAGAEAVRAILRSPLQVDALVCSNDAMALGALEEIERQGLTLAVAGFDDVAPAARAALTTIRQSIPDQVKIAGKMLLELMRGEEVPEEQREIPLLVTRNSCGCGRNEAHELLTSLARASASSGMASVLQDAIGTGPNGKPLNIPKEIEQDSRDHASSSLLSEYELEDVHNVGEQLFATLNQEDELMVAAREFPRLGIDTCCVSLYDDPKDPVSTARLVLAYDEKRVFPISRDGMQFPTRAILPPGILDADKRTSFMVQSLFRGHEQIGFVVFSMGTRKWRVYEILRRELSIALKGASLLRAVQNQAEELERQVKLRTSELEDANTQLRLEILERSRVETELARREEHFRELALLLPAMVVELDLHWRVTFINRAGTEMLELPVNDSGRSESFLSYVYEDDTEYVEEMFTLIAERRQHSSGEFRLISSSGKNLCLLCEANPIVKNGLLKGVRLSGMNIRALFTSAIMPEELFFKHYHFSPRVKEVLSLMIQGYSSKEMAQKLDISENTIKAHIRAMYAELGVDKRADFFKILREYQVHHFGYQSYVFSVLSNLIRD